MPPHDGPMVARWGTGNPSAPLVVALHGNGTSEHSMIEIAPWLPYRQREHGTPEVAR